MYSTSLVLAPPFPVNLKFVVAPWMRGKQDPVAQVGRGASFSFWTSTRGSSANVLIRLEQPLGKAPTLHEKYLSPIHVRLWAEKTPAGLAALETVSQQLPAWLGFYDDWTAFTSSESFSLLPEKLKDSYRQNVGLRLGATHEIFKNTVASIGEQRVTGIEAMGGLRAILRQYAEPVFATGLADQPAAMLFFPAPTVIEQVPSWTWHRAGYDRARSETIVRLAQRADSLERMGGSDSVQNLAAALNSVPGIGPWTIAEVLQRTHGHPDAISVGDYHLAHHVGWVFDGVRGNDARMVQLLAPFAGNRHRVVTLMKAAGLAEPRKAPRYAPQDHRNH